MYAISFDLNINDLKQEYGEPYNNAYKEIRNKLEDIGFEWTQGSVYIYTGENSLALVTRAMNILSNIEWFRNSVRDIRAFRVEDWSNFTDIVKKRFQ